MDTESRTKKTPSKCSSSEYIDMTIMSTPRPQASSTVERKTLSSQYSHTALLKKLSNFEDINSFDESTDSSLGLVNNISSILQDHEQSIEESNTLIVNKIETERQLARQLLQRCGNETNNKSSLILDINKENDVNAQNLSLSRLNQSSKVPIATSKLSTNSVTFEPNEFTARSSEMVKNNSELDEAKSLLQAKCDSNGFSFNSTAAELMAKFTDDDFISGSRISNQFSADELSCRQNFNSIPMATENDCLEFSCFSGIMGDMDLTVDSRAGHKVSVGEYFSRKCGTLGQLSDTISNDRPNFGLIGIKSPERKNKPQPLINITNTTVNDQSSACTIDDKNKTVTNYNNYNDNDDDCTIMSLSKIAQALQTTDGTPRRLVDQLLRAKKKPEINSNMNSTSNTYTILPARASMPVINTLSSSSSSSSTLLVLNTSENNKKLLTKLSLDSKTLTDSINDIKYNKNDSSYCNNKNNSISSIKDELVKSNNKKKTDMVSLSPLLSQKMPPVLETFNYTKDKLSMSNCNEVKQEEKSIISLSRFNEKIIIGKNTQELYKCIIGVLRIADIEIRNESERWLICKLKLQQIQGDESNIEIDVPKNEILIEPRKCNSVKITVNLLKIGDPIMASLAIDVTDMSTHETVTRQHMMCFVPQELKNEDPSILTDIDECEIRIIDTQIPIILNKNEIKCLKIKNTSKETVILSATIVQNDDLCKFALSLEPRKIIVNSNEICEINVQYQGTIKDNNAPTIITSINNDVKNHAQVSIKIKTANKIYLYPIIIKMDTWIPEENGIDYLRCDTPQQYSTLSNWGNISPSSPHSISSIRSGRNSPRSTATGLTVTGDTIPIKSTNSSLIWTSVRVGKHETREFTIRNTSNNKIKLQAIITDNENSFKFLKDRNMSTTITLGLQHMESKTFTVIFSPNNIGPAAGRITFMHYDCKRDGKEPRSPKIIPLYGHGGYAKVSISQALKIMGDQMWLSLGKLNLSGVLNSRIKLENSGDLPAYTKITLAPKAVYPSVETSWHIEPTELILGPKQIHWITVQFRPRKEDLIVVRGDVADMGTLTITHGDEPTRWRIRRLYKKLCESGQLRRQDQDDIFSNVVYPICKIFPDEMPMHNLNIIRDSPQDLGTLCRGVNRHVVTLTVELNVDDTIPIFHDDYDGTNESQMFQSLRSDITVICASNNNSYMPLDSSMAIDSNPMQNINRHIYSDEFTVSPTAITLTPPLIHEATVMITSSSAAAQPFETMLSHGQYINVIPSEGMVPAGRGVILKIQCQKNISNNINDLLQIYTTNERRSITINIIPERR